MDVIVGGLLGPLDWTGLLEHWVGLGVPNFRTTVQWSKYIGLARYYIINTVFLWTSASKQKDGINI